MMKGVALFFVRGYSLSGDGSLNMGPDGVFVLGEVALDLGQIELGKDACVRLALKRELERLLDELLWRDGARREFLPVFGEYGHRVRGRSLVPDRHLEGRL